MNPKGKGIAAAVEEATKIADEIAKTKPERLDPKPAEEESSKRKHEGEEEKPKKKVKKEGDEDKPKKKVKKEGDEDKSKKNAKNDDEKEKGEKKRKNKDEGENKEKKKKPSKCLLPLVIYLIYLFLPLAYFYLRYVQSNTSNRNRLGRSPKISTRAGGDTAELQTWQREEQ